MKTIRNASLSLFALAALSFGQTATPQTTLSVAVARGDKTITLVSNTPGGYTIQAAGLAPISGCYMDKEYMTIANTGLVGGTTWNVVRSQDVGQLSTHPAGTIVYCGPVGGGGVPFDQGAHDRVGSCTASNFSYLPIIEVLSGTLMNCDVNGKYSPLGIGEFLVAPTQCAFSPTTLTVTNTYPLIGASNALVLKGISNAAAGTMTLVCNFLVPTSVQALKGALISDVTLLTASSATTSGVVPTSLGTSTLSSITFPTAATTEVASTVTPVAIGGTVTTVSPTAYLSAVSTDGAFFTFKSTYSTAVDLSTDLKVLQYTMPILQSAASVSDLYVYGLAVHYRAASSAGLTF